MKKVVMLKCHYHAVSVAVLSLSAFWFRFCGSDGNVVHSNGMLNYNYLSVNFTLLSQGSGYCATHDVPILLKIQQPAAGEHTTKSCPMLL